MTVKHIPLILCTLFVWVLAACQPIAEGDLRGRLLLWHSGGSAMTATLDELTDRFEAVYPDVSVVVVAVPANQLLQRYTEAAANGLGPDLFIGSTRWISDLAQADLIEDIDAHNPNLDVYLSGALVNVRYDDTTYGIPFTLQPAALYVNTTLTDTPPATLTELLSQAAEGRTLALTTRFDRLFWGVQSYGGRLFDDGGRVSLNQGAFASWLTWLREAQSSAGVSISADPETMLTLFTRGETAYYVGRPTDLPHIRETMDFNSVAVVPLPSGPSGTAGPLLDVNAFMFNPNSPGAAPRTAVTLAQFLTNTTQSATLMRELSLVPANRQVRVDSRAFPVISGFIVQSRTAVPMPNTLAMDEVLARGDTVITRVLDGLIEPAEAAEQFTQTVNETAGFSTATPVTDTCIDVGELRVWHAIDEADLIQRIVDDYKRACPGMTVELGAFNAASAMVTAFTSVANAEIDIAPDALLVPNDLIFELASQGAITSVAGEVLQQYIPSALNAVDYQGAVFGYPFAVNVNALYYNVELVSDPPTQLANLATEATAGRGVFVPTTFHDAYWGISAFGATPFDADSRVVLDRTGFDQWLTWLANAQSTPNIITSTDARAGLEAFSAGELAYFIGDASALASAREALGEDGVGVALLPAGPAGDAAPLLKVDAWVINAQLTPAQQELTRRFAAFATNADSQRRLLEESERIPANVNLDIDDPARATFRDEAVRAVSLPNTAQTQTLLQMGDSVYRAVLQNGEAPSLAALTFANAVNEANGLAILPTATPTAVVPTTPTAMPETPQEATPIE